MTGRRSLQEVQKQEVQAGEPSNRTPPPNAWFHYEVRNVLV